MSSNRPPARALRHRWLFVRTNLQVKRNLDKVQNLLRRAKAVDYNGIVLADYKLQFLDRVPAWYFRHVAALMRLASKLGLEIYPTVCPIGYSNGLLSHNPNLAEGVPVRDAFGKSDGFRRPGYVISIEPGMMYEHGRYMFYASGPWAMERNRKISVTDLENKTHGDAAFADYTVIAGVSRTF